MKDAPGTVAVYALTSAGAEKARLIAAGIKGAEVFLPERLARTEDGEEVFDKLRVAMARNYDRYSGHVVVAAAGIVVRSIAPLLKDKTTDPAVVVVDQEGRFAVSLLSGHLGGANSLAILVADVLRGQPVITTATDAAGKPSIEVVAQDRGLKVENLKALSRISLAVLEDRAMPVYDPDRWLLPHLRPWPELFYELDGPPDKSAGGSLVLVSCKTDNYPGDWLLIRPPSLWIGIGCNRNTELRELQELMRGVFDRFQLSISAVKGIASIDAKKDEAAILRLADMLGGKTRFFTPDELAAIETPNPSANVEKHMGVKNVCEAAAMLAAKTDRLLVTKQKSRNATMAVALTASI